MHHDIPASLEKMQQWFADLITAPVLESDGDQIPLFSSEIISEIRENIAPSHTLESEERMGLYKQQYWWRLIGVMQDLFPALVSLLGYTEFNRQIAEPYLASHIPKDWFISHIGDDLPQWLDTIPRESEVPFKELAQLDLVYEQLLFADILPGVTPSSCEREVLYLQPFVFLFEMDTNLLSYRKQLLQGKKPLLKKWRKKRYLVLYRLHEENFFEEIHSDFFDLLSHLQTGARLQALIPLLERCEDVTSLFQKISSRGWLTHLDPSKGSDRKMQILVQKQK